MVDDKTQKKTNLFHMTLLMFMIRISHAQEDDIIVRGSVDFKFHFQKTLARPKGETTAPKVVGGFKSFDPVIGSSIIGGIFFAQEDAEFYERSIEKVERQLHS